MTKQNNINTFIDQVTACIIATVDGSLHLITTMMHGGVVTVLLSTVVVLIGGKIVVVPT